MPKGIYDRTESKPRQPQSKETKRKIGITNSIKLKGNIPWNKGKIGLQIAWNKGQKMPDEQRKKLSKFFKGKHISPNTEFKKGHKPPQGNKHWGWKGRKIIKCLICEKELSLPFSKKRKFCSKECWIKSRIGVPITEEAKRKSSESQTREKNHNWKGGKHINCGGYAVVYKPEHPFASGKYIMEHRLVMEQILGRYLEPFEIIHHKNGIKTDNRPENLQLAIRKAHFGNVRCPHCLKEFLIK